MKQTILVQNKPYSFKKFKKEEDLTALFALHYRHIISQTSLWINLKSKLKSSSFRNFKHSIGDGFLLNWDTPDTPTLYLTEIELERHNVDTHILPQLGNMISFIQSATMNDRGTIRDKIYKDITSNTKLCETIRAATKQEVRHLLDNSFEEMQLLLVIDHLSRDLSIGLEQIEKAINIKIRTIEMRQYLKGKEAAIFFTDSEQLDELVPESGQAIYSLDYHLKRTEKETHELVSALISHARQKQLKVIPMKCYIGFYGKKGMFFSCVPRRSKAVFYSKAQVSHVKAAALHLLDVRKKGHLTQHFPTEIVLTDRAQLKHLKTYFDKVCAEYAD